MTTPKMIFLGLLQKDLCPTLKKAQLFFALGRLEELKTSDAKENKAA